MFQKVLTELAYPAFRRAGTFVGTSVATAGIAADVADIQAAVVLLLGVGFDLVMSHVNRKRSK